MAVEPLPFPVGASGLPGIAEPLRDDLLEREVREFMTPGCVALSEDASVADAAEALARHRVHAVLVIGATNGTPLGWLPPAACWTVSAEIAASRALVRPSPSR